MAKAVSGNSMPIELDRQTVGQHSTKSVRRKGGFRRQGT